MARLSAIALAAPLAVFGCTGTGAILTVPLPATAIIVDPADFMGDVPCLPAEGAMHFYVATLTSVHAGGTLDAGAIALPSSPPVSCTQSVSFQRVVDGTAYVADIDGYDTDDIRPLGAADGGPPGSRIMVDHLGRYVTPRWTTSCGRALEPRDDRPSDAGAKDGGDAAGIVDASTFPAPKDAQPGSLDTGVVPYGRCTGHALEAGQSPDLEGPVCAIANSMITMRGCEPLRDVNPPAHQTTAVTVDLADALGPCLRCGTRPGEISEFSVSLDGSSTRRTKPCGESSAPIEVPPGKLATFSVTAYAAGAVDGGGTCPAATGTPSPDSGASSVSTNVCADGGQAGKTTSGIWCTRCYRQPVPGVTLRAVCDPLGQALPPPY